jgi:putative NIF3 family GTP cyclohydrolase 1 type 2
VLLSEAPPTTKSLAQDIERGPATILLTNDLTAPVVDEALAEGARMIICYRMSTRFPSILASYWF